MEMSQDTGDRLRVLGFLAGCHTVCTTPCKPFSVRLNLATIYVTSFRRCCSCHRYGREIPAKWGDCVDGIQRRPQDPLLSEIFGGVITGARDAVYAIVVEHRENTVMLEGSAHREEGSGN